MCPNDGQAGVHFVGYKVKMDLKWLYREQAVSDFGVDAHIEVWEGGYPSGKLIGCQIKSGASFFTELTATGITFRFKQKHLDYWLNHALPIVIVLHHPDTETCFWARVTEGATESTGQDWKMEIPYANLLTEKSREQLLAFFELTEGQLREEVLLSAQGWMESIKQGTELFLEVEEYTNEFSGIAGVRIVALTDVTGADEVLDDIELKAVGWEFSDSLDRTFPWARFEIDDAFYYDRELDTFKAEYGFLDKENDEWHYSQEDFDIDRENAPDIRPHTNTGEIAEYRLEMKLNELGEGFLTYKNFTKA